MASCQTRTQPLSFPLLNRTGEESKIENLKNQDTDKDMDHLAITIKGKTDLPSGKLIYYPLELDGEKQRQKLKHFLSTPFFPGSTSVLLSWLLCPSFYTLNRTEGWGIRIVVSS